MARKSILWSVSLALCLGAFDLIQTQVASGVQARQVKTHKVPKTREKYLIYNEKCSYGRLSFDAKASDPTVTYTIVNIDGEEIHSLTVKKSQLTHP